MLASNRHRLFSRASFALVVALLADGLWQTTASPAADVYFPTTGTYRGHNFDPFDQAKPAAASEGQPAENGDVKLSSEIQLIGTDPFGQTSPVSAAAPQVTRTAFQAAPSAAPEPLPPPKVPQPSAPAPEPGADWTPRPLADLSTNIVLPGGVLPRDYWTERTPQHVAFFDPCGASRGWPVNTFNWVASCFCSNPLYFEEVNLERYGYGCGCYGPCCSTCVQSAVSAAHFFATVPALPYMMAVDCPCDCDYTLGNYRPGSCPPWRYTCCTRCSALGAVSAGGVATGLVFLIP